jgi:hypothetical protein
MKINLLTAVLVGVLLVCSLLATWISVRYFFSVKELQQLQGEMLRVNQTVAAVQSLAAQAVDYSKRNPAIDPILQSFELKPKTNMPPLPPPGPIKGNR